MEAKLTRPSFFKYISALEKLDCGAISHAIDVIASCLNRGGAVFTAGNGGSYSIAQHFAADLRGPLIKQGIHYRDAEFRRVVHLGSNMAEFTALCNDEGYHDALVYMAEREGIIQGDVLFSFSVSGTSLNLLRLMEMAAERKVHLVLATTFFEASHDLVGYGVEVKTNEVDNDWYGVVEGVFSCIAHEIANRVKERLNEKDS